MTVVDLSAANNLPPRNDELFRIYARFEFALKMAGYCALNGKAVETNWDAFANSSDIGKLFFKHVRDAGMCPKLMNDPPKAEAITNGQWGFATTATPPESAQALFGMVRRVRNNLFHGGKYFDDDKQRNQALVDESIAILLLAVAWHKDVNFYFEGRA
ncbi:hypothetical protein GOA99_22845 [Sinorhizobium meliloti]|uniref:hypothetical protein n=1 Tax=Sinorhizobium TaxID=28105 RepID=UPI001297FBCC|nr:hypothetical protein [Sinorhizobium meliloti]GCA52812.1 hypothetical protein KGO5_05278 [Sinorhizobium sp. KGO-5]MDW9364156.1 hypothetical protein [Sinorhizobium meliloti]MDW9387466.1 hypothetical protein [Sinorhizobium meliloti]MDW9602109.1 hypothetical protein [Sinorhizobium meliloti]MQV06810.1 hypothetical protein [Sinorhizobium meliloti]